MSTDHQTTSTTPNIHDHESKSSDLNSTPSQLSPQKQQPQQQQSHTDEKQTDISKQTGETDSNQIQPDSEPQKQKEEEEEEETEEQIIEKEKEKEKEKKDGEQQQEQQQEEESGVFSGWGFTSVNKVAPNMNSISSLLSSTGDSVGNLLNAPTSFFSSDNNENNDDNATNNNASNSDAPDAVPHNGDLVFNENSENNNNNNNNNYNNNLNENKNSPNGNNIEGEDLGVAASNLANVATAELEQASKAAQETIGKAAQELGRGWGTLNSFLDDMLAPEHGNNNGDVGSRGTSSKENGGDVAVELLGPSAAGKDINVMFKELFPHLGSSEDEEVVDHYKCSLIQKYRCYLNNSTPEKAFPLRGRLFVTMSNIAMYMTEDGGVFGGNSFGINIPFQEVIKIQKGSKSMLRVVTRSQTSFIFAEFESDTHYQGALSLLEQLGAAAATGVPPPMPTPTPAATTTQTPPHSASSSPAKTEESASADNEAAKSEEKQS